MKIGKVEKYIHETLETKGAMFFTLIDPVDYASEKVAVKVGVQAAENGADAILVGGSTGAQGILLDSVTKRIKEKVSVPVILFPGNIATITKYADALYFMTLLNSRNPYWHSQVQMLSAPIIKAMGIEPLPVGYIMVTPGGTAGWIGDVNLIPREKPKIASSLALTGEYLGNRIIVTDVGSNPKLQGFTHVPLEMIRAVKNEITVPYIVAGGISTVDDARNVIKSGADIVQIGTAIEKNEHADAASKAFAKVVKEEGKRKLRS